MSDKAHCTSDEQCRYDRVCGEEGFCRAPEPAPDAGPAPDTPPAPDPAPRVATTPAEITFERITDGDPGWRRARRPFELRNAGRAPLDIRNVELRGDDAFELSAHQQSNQTEPGLLAPGESFEWTVWYETVSNHPSNAHIVIESNDPRGEVEVPVFADVNPPCVQVEPSEHLIFELASPNHALVEYVRLTNCAEESVLSIREARLAVDAGGGFALLDAELPGDLPEDAALVPPGETAAIPVLHTGNPAAFNTGELVLETNVPEQHRVRITLLRETSANDCPSARAGGRVGDDEAFSNSLRAEVGSVIELSGRDSVDPDGEVTDYYWTIVSQPGGMQQELVPNRDARDVQLHVEQPGQYLIELRVWDDAGAPNCGGVARVTVVAE